MTITDESKLPKWAQGRIDDLRSRITELETELDNTRLAHSVLRDRDWFTLPGPSFESPGHVRYLWALDADEPIRLCNLRPGDLILLGRRIDKPRQ